MVRGLSILAASLALSAALAWADPGKDKGKGNAYGKTQDDKGKKKSVAVPEPSAWAEMAVCAVGLGLLTRRIARTSKA